MKTKTQFTNRILSLVLSIMMVVSMLPMNIMTASAAETTESAIDLSTLTGTYVIRDSGEYTFIGSGSYGIKVESGNPTIVLNNASITVGKGSSAIDVASGSNATIFVMGDNTVDTDSEWGRAGGIFVAEGGTVNITSNSNANILRAHGSHASAIGGKYDYDNNESYNAGNINISNVTVYAYTNNFYASAIGAAGEGTCGTINITNAVIYAYGAGDKWTSAPGIGSAMGLIGYSEMIPVVIISDSEVHTFRHNSASDYIGYLGDVEYPSNATGSINCGEGGSVTNSTIYCYTGLDATTTDKTVKYGALGGLLKEDGTCEGEHSGGTATCTTQAVCGNCGASYGEKNANNHNWENGVCTYGCNTIHEPHDWSGKDGICTVCGATCTHTGGEATCTEKAVCTICGASYGELGGHTAEPTYAPNDKDSTKHDMTYSCCGTTVTEDHTLDVTTGVCTKCGADASIATVTDGTNTCYAADAATLYQAVTAILETGSRTFTVELPADAEAGMITAIRRAICDTEGVADGSIHLTLKGVTTIPGTTNWDGVAFGPGDIYDEAGKIVDQELVTQLASINLPDVTEIGAQAFYFCENLVTVSAPKAQTIGAQALGYTAVTSVEFPELTTIPTDMFSGTWTLSSAKFPKVTTIEQGGLLVGAKFMPENNPTPFPLELTAEGDITFNGSNHFNIKSQNYSGKVDLVLCCDKADKVTKNEDGTATWQVRDDLSYTFKSITFKHSYVDGKCTVCSEDCAHTGGTATCTTLAVCDICKTAYGELGGHTPAEDATYTDNSDGTHSYTCSSCGNPFAESHTFTDGACAGCGVIGGYCGEEGNEQNVIWTYANGTLTISGTGAMADQFDNYNNRPWEEYVDQITTIVVNDGITSIGEAAFWRFQKLTTAKLPDSLTTISQQAFYGCTALKTVNFPANLKTIEGWAFLGCALEIVTLPEGLTTIGYRAFSECKNLTSVTVPASVTTIDEGAFGYSPAKITVAEDNLNYSSDEHGVLFDKDKTTLIYCRPNIEVETYTIPSTVTEICKEAFYGCKNLATITIPDGVQKIGSSAFGSCEAMTTITIPAGVTTIEANTFYDCTALTAVTIPAGVTTIDMWAFSGCTALTTVTIPVSVTSIAYNAFSNCSALTTVNVPCTWDGSLYTFDESVTLNKVHNWVDGTCTACCAPCDHKDSTHTTSNNNGDGTHSFTCSVCVNTVIEAHTGGTATCTEQAKCEHCGASYGDFAAHSMDYVADEEANTITYRCGTCDTKTVTYTLVIPTGVVYGSSAMAVPHYDCSDKTYQGDSPEITLDGALLKDFVPGAKTYEVVMTWGGKTVSGEYTIAKAEVSIAIAPTPNTLTYISEAQYLISAGEAVGGTMVYSLTENGEYTTSIPQGTNAGDYTVWYYVQGDANHNDSAKDSVSVTIAKATPTAEDFIFTAPTDLIYDGTAKPATVTVKDGIVGMGEVKVMYFRYAGMLIDNEREPIYPGRYKVGIWIEDGDNYNAVYSGERIWLGSEFEIKYLTTDAKADISGTVGSNGWYTSDVTLIAPEGYQISNTKYNDGFTSVLTFSAEQNETITYYLKDANGDVAEKTVEMKIDKTAPSAQYQIGTDGWKQFINTITFGLFCKDYKTVDIEYTDALSGVAEKQYYISSEEITNTSRIAWLNYTDTLSLNATGKYFIYMRVVDNAGNEVILNTEGIVIYEDSIQVTESVSATYNAGTDKAVTVKLNGNTVNAIQNGNAVLTAGTDYTVSAVGTITLKASYLDALKAGEYTFTVSYNPQGVETDKVNMTTTFTLIIDKADGKVSNINISNKTYDGTAVTAPTFDKLGDGAATIEYKVRGADDSTYTTTAPKDAGNYVVRVTVVEGTNHKAASATTYFAIASAELRDVSVQQVGTLTYTGEALTPAVSANAVAVNNQPITFTYSTELEGPYSTEIPSFTNAGWTHRVYYRATAENHNASYGSFLVEIEKATVTEPAIASKPYSGSAQTADISDTDLYTVEKNNGGTEKGSYDVVLKLKDSANYKWSTTNNAEVTLQFLISAAQNAWDTNPSISGWTYGEAAKTPVGTAKYGAVKVVYTGKANDGTDYNSETAPTKAGNYTATFTVTGTEDYSGLSEQVNFTIAKKAVTVTANDASKTYGESDPALTYTHTELVGSDALVITVARTSGENANTYTITASQAEGANPNYEITFKTGIFTIRKAPLTVTVEDKTAIYGDGIPTYTVKYEGFKNGDDKEDLGGALAFECGYAQFSDKGEYTIKASGYTSGNYTISYVDGKLTVNAKPITVTIQNASSVYGDTLAELKATDNGIVNGDANVYSLATTATGTSNVGKYAITGTALDSNYDVTFVNGEYEITKREITITVDAKNTVVNTTLPTYTYKVEGLVGVDTLVAEPTLTCNANITLIGEYDITATGADAGGNYSIKYVPAKLTVLTDNAVDAAAGYTEELKDYDPATVTSEDKAELDEMLSEINTILADETTTDNGKKALEEVKEQVEKLIKEITDAAAATDTENTEKVENVTPENVTPENKTDLEGAKADLEKALEDNGGNYTEDEKKAIEDEIKRIDDALKVIGNVEAVEKVISKLPAVDTVKPDDEEAIKAITDAQTAYNALSDYEKSLVDEATKVTLDKLAAALVAYDIVEGDGSSWTEDSDHNITFVANGLFSKFVGIKVDGKDVNKANYEAKAGSTIITLKASYMDTLAVGEHTISVVYTDGSTDGTFNVRAKANTPATGDDFNIALYASLMVVSVTALVVLLLVSKKRGQAR